MIINLQINLQFLQYKLGIINLVKNYIELARDNRYILNCTCNHLDLYQLKQGDACLKFLRKMRLHNKITFKE